MKEILLTTLETIITAVIPVLVAYLVVFLNAKAQQAKTQTQSDKVKSYIDEVTNAVTTAVTATSQTYVDALKKNGAFTKDAQTEALNKARETAISLLSPAAANFIYEVYGDINEYLTVKIEETVRDQKVSVGTIMTGIGVLESTE